MSFSSEELNYLIYRYFKESGFDHSAFTFASESNVDKSDVNPSDVLPGTLIYVIQKGLQYIEIEASVTEDGGDASPPPQPVSLLSPYSSLQNLPNTPLKGSLSLSTSTPAAPSDSVSSLKRARPGATSFSLFLPYASETNHNDPSDVVSRQPNTIPILPSDVSLLSGHAGEVFLCSWNPSSEVLASGSGDATARIWQIGTKPSGKFTGEEISKSSLVLPHQGSDPNSTNEVTTLEWNKAGSRLATGNYDGNFRVWDLQGNLLLKVQGHNGPIFAIKWSSDSQYLLTASVDMTSVVWDANTGAKKYTYSIHTDPVLDVDWASPTTFATCSSDHTIHVFEVGRAEPVKSFLTHTSEVNAIRWDPTGRFLASCSDDKTAKIWRLDSSRTEPLFDFKEHDKEIYTISWSPDGSILASASFDNTIRLWDTKNGTCLRVLRKHTEPVYSVAFSPDGKYIASGSFDKKMFIWEVAEGTVLKSYEGGGGIFDVKWNRTGNKVAVCFSNGPVAILDF